MLGEMHSDLEKLVARGKIEEITGQQLDLLPKGTYCVHKSWGAGKVVKWDRLNLKVVVDFEDKPGHELGMKFAGLSLTPIEKGTFFAERHSNLETLQDLAKSDSPEVVKLALQTSKGKLFLDQLETMIKGRVIPEGKYKSWWESTKKRLRQDRQFVVPAKRSDPLQLREEGGEPSEDLINDFREARDLKGKVKAVETIIKDFNVFDSPKEQLAPVISEISDAAKRGVKLQFVPAVELILIREELATKIKDFTTPKDDISIADILASDKTKIPELLEKVSLTRMRQILKTFPDAFGEDEWVDEMLSLLPECNLRSITEVANHIKNAEQPEKFVEYIRNGLQQRALSSDALAWLCRERKGMAEDVFDNSLSLTVMSSLESDQLNEDGAVRIANKLRDLISDDQELIPDLIKGANINMIRNFAARLVTCAAFDDLSRKSLMARVIKMHPEVQDLVGHREKTQEDALIVSEESLAERKAAFDKLVKEEIPQNREDIKVARSYGDLRENFEYKSAKEYQRVLMKRQDDWERDLKLASPTDFSNPDTKAVSIGTVVELEPTDGGDSLTYTILGAWDGDPDKGIIAYLSERGRLLLEKKVGDKVSFPKDGGEREFKIASIKAWKS